jgi:hypothetical protein
MAPEIEQLVRDYATGKISWQLLQERGIENYLNLLGMLGELGLRPPRMPLERDAEGLSALRNAILETDAELDKAVIERDGYTAESRSFFRVGMLVPDVLFNPGNGFEGHPDVPEGEARTSHRAKKLERSRTAPEFPLVFTFVGFIIAACIGVVAIFVAFLALKVT